MFEKMELNNFWEDGLSINSSISCQYTSFFSGIYKK